ncbi:SurA N-terminal domain-containing protein [Allofrancisella guangzhouensis]|uniref:SurA N-terminal domain-containing protein n=1 Tax=Allofrancisella guangzhouensis TaxID=594679 RepID=UPI000A606828|nr:SurA N-terminal domain-containing protein [Allofrancisella guangzhouensis]
MIKSYLFSISVLFIFFCNSYADIASSLFQNSFNSDFNNNNQTSTTQLQNSNKKNLINKTVAIVNNKPITSLELDQEVQKLQASNPQVAQFNTDELTIKRLALQDLISQSVLIQLAEQNNITISEQQLDSAIQEIAAKNGMSVDSLRLNLEASGMSFSKYKDKIRQQLMVNQLQQQAIAQQVYVSPEEIQKYLKKHQKEFYRQMSPVKTYSLKNLIIALPDSKKARKDKIGLLKKLAMAVNNGDISFSDVVEQFSEAPNASTGGTVSHPLKFDAIPSIYKTKVEKLKEGQASEPFIVNNTVQMIYIDNIHTQAPLLSKEITKYYVYGIVIKVGGSMTEKGAKSSLDRALVALSSGEIFTKVAEKFNQDYDHADGEFGWVSTLDTPPSLPPTAFAKLQTLKEDEFSDVFQADPKTWMILKYTKTKNYNAAEELKEQKALEAIFSEKAQQIYKTWLTSMKDDAYIEILEDDLKTPDLY